MPVYTTAECGKAVDFFRGQDFLSLCGGKHSEDEARIVSLRYIYELDHSICLLKDMPYDRYAERKSPAGEWIVNGLQKKD